MKAIQTVYHGPTETRGSRIIASCDGGRIICSYDSELSNESNHRRSAWKLIEKMGWERCDQDLRSGFLKNGEFVHILDR